MENDDEDVNKELFRFGATVDIMLTIVDMDIDILLNIFKNGNLIWERLGEVPQFQLVMETFHGDSSAVASFCHHNEWRLKLIMDVIAGYDLEEAQEIIQHGEWKKFKHEYCVDGEYYPTGIWFSYPGFFCICGHSGFCCKCGEDFVHKPYRHHLDLLDHDSPYIHHNPVD